MQMGKSTLENRKCIQHVRIPAHITLSNLMRGKQCFCREKSWNGGRRKGGLFSFCSRAPSSLSPVIKTWGIIVPCRPVLKPAAVTAKKKAEIREKEREREEAPGGKIRSDKFMHAAYWLFFYGFIYMPKGQKWLKKVRYSIDKRALV